MNGEYEKQLDLGTAASIARAATLTDDVDHSPAWLKEVRVTVVFGHPGADDTEHSYAWAMEP